MGCLREVYLQILPSSFQAFQTSPLKFELGLLPLHPISHRESSWVELIHIKADVNIYTYLCSVSRVSSTHLKSRRSIWTVLV